MAQEEASTLVKKTKKSNLLLLIVLLLAGAVAYLVYLNVHKTHQLEESKKSSAQKISEEDSITAKMSKYVYLPKNEKPTVVTVQDVTKLQDRPFFANAKNGDKVLLYTQAKKAYLYRPSENKLVEVAGLNFGQDSTSTATKK